MQLISRTGGQVTVAAEALGELEGDFRGAVLRPGDAGYETARIVFNGAFDSRPGLIARCDGTADVIDAVRFAARHDLLAAVRAGGHSIAGKSTCAGGLVIDLSPMRAVLVDPARRVARVQGGATWGDVDRETQAFGLAAPGGIVSHTGVGGLTLHGGIGWLRNKHGLACDNLVAAEVVTAAGELVRASERENHDLLWALRGGGGNFGVVTCLELALHEVGPQVAASFPFFAGEEAARVLRGWRGWVETAPDAVTSEVVLWTAPDVEGLPEGARGRAVAIPGAVYCGPPEEGARTLEPMRELGRPVGEIGGRLPYRVVQQAFDPFFPNTGEIHGYWKSLHLRELTDAAVALLVAAARDRTSAESMIVVEHVGAGVRRVPPEATAFAGRDAAYIVNFIATWRAGGDADRHTAWARRAWDRLAPVSTGAVYLNFTGAEGDGDLELVRDAFGANYERLVEVKTRWDPLNLFRRNLNVPPRRPASAASAVVRDDGVRDDG